MTDFSDSAEKIKAAANDVRSAMSARTVFAEAVSHNGTTVVPAARVRGGFGGGGGGGEGDEGEGSGMGMGYGVSSRAIGAFVIDEGGRVRWRPAVDVTRMFLMGCSVAIAYFFFAWLGAR